MPSAYSTYFGGSSAELANAIKMDKDGFLYIARYTKSDNFPVTENAYSTTRNGDLDGYVVKFDIKSNEIIWSTYLGWAKIVYLSDMEIDGDLFITKLSNDRSQLLFLTFLGNNGTESFENFDMDSQGNIYICVSTSSSNYPFTKNAFDLTYNGCKNTQYPWGGDFTICLMDSGLNKTKYATYLGGTGDDYSHMGIVENNELIIVGSTKSNDFPVTNDALFNSFRGGTSQGGDIVILKFSIKELLNFIPQGIHKPQKESSVILYPNPVFEQINIKELTNIDLLYQISDSSVKAVKNGIWCSNYFDVSDFPEGQYFLSLICISKIETVSFLKL